MNAKPPASTSRSVTVVLIEDHEVVRTGLQVMLAREGGIHIAGMAETGAKGLELIDKVLPEVAVVDLNLPSGMSGKEVCEEIVRRHPKIPVLIFTAFLEDTVVKEALAAGAKGYVYKDAGGKELSKAIQMVARGEEYFDWRVAGRVGDSKNIRRSTSTEPVISKRETELLRLIARGATNAEIAKEMIITVNTVKSYLSRALFKLNCHSRSEAAALAAKLGLL